MASSPSLRKLLLQELRTFLGSKLLSFFTEGLPTKRWYLGLS